MNHTKARIASETIVKDILKVTESPAVKKGSVSKKDRETLEKKVLAIISDWYHAGYDDGKAEK